MTMEMNLCLFAQGLFSGSSGYQFIAETYIVCLSREFSELICFVSSRSSYSISFSYWLIFLGVQSDDFIFP